MSSQRIIGRDESVAARRTIFIRIETTAGAAVLGASPAAADLQVHKASDASNDFAGTLTEIGDGWYTYEFDVTEVDTVGIVTLRIAAAAWAKFMYFADVHDLAPQLDSGTAQGGTASSLTLALTAPTTADLFIGATIALVGGTGSGQISKCTDYSTGRVASVDPDWVVTPNNTTRYHVIPELGSPFTVAEKDAVVAGGGGGGSGSLSLSSFIGDIRKGDWIRFSVDNYSLVSWNATHFDIIDNETREVVVSDRTLNTETDLPDLVWVLYKMDDDFDTDGTSLIRFKEGRMYSIRIKDGAGAPASGESFIVGFRVDPEDRRAFLGTVEKGKTLHFMHREEERDELFFDVWDSKDDVMLISNSPMSNTGQPGNNLWKGEIDSEGTDDLVVGQTYWVRVKDIAADDPNLSTLYSFTVLPRMEYELRRLLAMAGENMVFDNFGYDQAGNILGMRVRLFDDASDAANATAGVTEPEPGEIANYLVTQEHDVARNTRTFHSSVLEFLSGDFPPPK